MKDKLSALYTRVKNVLQKEGLIPLVRTGFTFLAQHLFRCGTYYLYEHTMRERNESDFMPKIKDFTLKIIFTNQQAYELASQGFDLYSHSIYTRKRLDKGAVAFCILIGRDIAHVGWVAMTEEAKKTFEPFPYRVDFLKGEACTGGTVTIPKYEGNGLMTYGYYKKFQFLKERGILRSRNAVDINNVASQRVHAKFVSNIYARARYLKILWWQSWKETPLVSE